MSAPRPPQSGGAMMGIGGCVCVRTTDKRPTHRVQSRDGRPATGVDRRAAGVRNCARARSDTSEIGSFLGRIRRALILTTPRGQIPAPLDSGRPFGPFSAIATLKFGASTIAPVTVRQRQREMVWSGGSQIVMFSDVVIHRQEDPPQDCERSLGPDRCEWVTQPRTVSGGHVTWKGEPISRTLPLRKVKIGRLQPASRPSPRRVPETPPSIRRPSKIDCWAPCSSFGKAPLSFFDVQL